MFARLGGRGFSNSPSPTEVGVSASPDQNTWEIPILAGFSFSQTTNSTEVTVNEAGFISRRSRVMYNDSLAPVEFSVSTYIRPTQSTTPNKVSAPEQVLWAMLMGADGYAATGGRFYNTLGIGSPSPATAPNATNAINSGNTTSNADTFDFSASNYSYYPAGNSIIFQVREGATYKTFEIRDAQIGSVTIDFDIEGIATAQWSGMGTSIVEGATEITGANNFGVNLTDNFIRNKLSTLVISSYLDADTASPGAAAGSPGTDTYDITITGGSFTVENNFNFLIPEELGKVNQTVGNITGTRSISGSLTCYYDTTVSASKSAELWTDLLNGNSGSPTVDTALPDIRNAHNITINIGGDRGARLIIRMPAAHLEIPTINPDELYSLEVNYHAMPTSGNFDLTNEATVTYAV